MPNKLKISSASLVAKARKEIMEIDAKKAIGMVGLDDVVIVDIRDFRERQRTGYIRDSFHCPRGMAEFWVDPESPYFRLVFDEKNIPILLRIRMAFSTYCCNLAENGNRKNCPCHGWFFFLD